MNRRSLQAIVAASTIAMISLSACARAGESNATSDTSETGDVTIQMWTHSAGNPAEIAVYDKIIADFNASQDKYKVVREDFPQASYNDSVQGAATSGTLPCLLDMDGPIVANWAWAGYIQPIGLKKETTDRLLPTAISEYKGEIYAAGYWDAALAILARKSVLEKNNIRIPTLDKPWSVDEFSTILDTLQKAGYATPLDIGAEDTGEWWSYAYSPMLQSAGGDLIDRDTMLSAEGKLNGPEAVKFFTWFQDAFKKGWASNSGTVGNEEFNADKVALSYTGGWSAQASLDAVGDDLLILPAVDFGNGPKIGGASWQWGISSSCKNVEGAREYLEFSFQDKYITEFADTQIVIPATKESAATSKYFAEGAPFTPFVEYSREYAMLRPQTPAYAVISSVFEKSAKDIMNGAEVKSTLDNAVNEIDTNIKNNDNYGF